MSGGPFVVCNPVAGGGRGQRLLGPLLDALGGRDAVAHGVSLSAGDEQRLAREAIERGHDVVVALGGDGTWSHVAGALLAAERPCRLGLVPGGTGSDLAKSLGIPPNDLAACARIVRDGVERRIDVGRVEDRHFLNIVGFGYDVAVLEDSWTVSWLKGPLVYLYCALRQLGRFQGFGVAVGEADAPPEPRELLMLIVANGRVFGGGFQIAPQAALDDGALDLVAFGNAGLGGRLGLMVRLLQGRHGGSPAVSQRRGARFRLRFAEPPAYEVDGEWYRARSAALEISVSPKALAVLAPAP